MFLTENTLRDSWEINLIDQHYYSRETLYEIPTSMKKLSMQDSSSCKCKRKNKHMKCKCSALLLLQQIEAMVEWNKELLQKQWTMEDQRKEELLEDMEEVNSKCLFLH